MFAGQRRRSSNVRAMQLFHELKQQFPTIPDQIVTSCISSYVQSNAQGKKPNLLQLIETAIADNKLEQMGRSPQQLETPQPIEEATPSEVTCVEAEPEQSVEDKVTTKTQPESELTDMTETSGDRNRNIATKEEATKTTAAKRPSYLDIKSDSSSSFQEASLEKRQFNIQLSEKCKDIYKLLNSSVSDKPPRSPISCKRVVAKTSPTKERSSLSMPEKRTEEPSTCQEVQRRLNQESPQSALVKKETCSTPTQTTDTLLGSPNVNVSLNVNCSVDVLQSPGQSRRAASSNSWSETPTTSRNITSVNFTLSPPASSPSQIAQGGPSTSGVTYSTSNFDPQKRVQSRLQITVGPGTSSVSSFKVRPRSFHLPESTHEVVPARAGSLNDLVESSDPPVILKQQARLERLRAELSNEKEKLEKVKKEVAELEKNRLEQLTADRDKEKQLLKDIKHLRYQCKELESDGETFYRNIYTGQRGPLTIDMPQLGQLRQQPSPNRSRLQYQGPPMLRPTRSDEEGPKWDCRLCTFLNHPVMDKCEQCDMPRIVHVSASPGDNIHIHVTPRLTRRITHSWVL